MAKDEQFDGTDEATHRPRKSQHTVSWTASEYIDHSRGASWYLLLIIISIALAAGIYFLIHDVFAAIVILILGFIVAVAAQRKPDQVDYELDNTGLKAGNKEYPYSHFRSFAIMHEGQLSSLVFMPLKRFVPPLSIYFDEDEEDAITSIVGEHLPMEQRSPDRIDSLTRRLRF